MVETELLGRVTTPWSGPVENADIPALRAAYSELMDRAAELIQPTGYDQDDVLLERLIVVNDRSEGGDCERTVPLPLLAEAHDIVVALDRLRAESPDLQPCRPGHVTIAALQFAILRETDIPLPDLRVPWNAGETDGR